MSLSTTTTLNLEVYDNGAQGTSGFNFRNLPMSLWRYDHPGGATLRTPPVRMPVPDNEFTHDIGMMRDMAWSSMDEKLQRMKNPPKKLYYLSGPYSADTPEGIEANIQSARNIAIPLWNEGHAIICPHLNTANFEVDCLAKYEDFIDGDCRMIDGCDGVILIPGWEKSRGALLEKAHAESRGIPVSVWPELPVVAPEDTSPPDPSECSGVPDVARGDRALRFNTGKVPLGYIDLKSFEPCARVMEYGATKYARGNWMKGRNVTELIDCLLRHIRDFQRKNDIDEESKCHVIGHIQANAMLIAQTLQEHPELDDR